MDCAREGCSCTVGDNRFEQGSAVYCCEKCATVCTDGDCRCTSSDCQTG